MNKKRITSFRELEVYQNTYQAMLEVMKKIVPKLPDIEKYDLRDQISRACKAIPRLIAEVMLSVTRRQVFKNILMMLWVNVMK